MTCPKCGSEMEHGKVSFLPMQGMDMMSMSYISDGERQKGLFRRSSHDMILTVGFDAEAYYCASCRLIVPLMKES
jgi:hypothetical protein